ncbi:MAG: methionine--tRNA ligase, partial [Parcubacteria group bacterium]|nr:methionine--tRNA ligase [Parcubacteria group bacterium]
MRKEREDNLFYITTSIAYVNAPPHIGYALELVFADVIARWRRLCGRGVHFLTGTDEHGAKIARAADAVGKKPREFVDENAERFRLLAEKLNISNDDFIRTSDKKRHWPGAEKMWRALEAAGDIEKRSYKGLYCVGHEAFVTRKDLVDGKCQDHASAPEVVEEENYFFLLSRYSARIREAISSGELKIFPEHRARELLNFIDQGLEDVSFSRPAKDIPWGIPVPGDASQTMYVWCDALTNYISALGYGSPDESLMG